MSRRFPAALMVGVLALSSIAPSVAFAGEGDQDVEGGGAVVDDVAGGDIDLGATADLGEDAGAAPVTDSAAPPAAADPATPAPVGAAETPDVAAEPEAPAAEVPPVAPAPAPADGASPAAAPEVAAPEAVAPAAAPEASRPRAAQPQRRKKAVRRTNRAKHRTVRVRVVASPAPAAAPRTVSVPVQAKVPVPRVIRISGAPSRPASPGAKSHVVEPGESLWSIATDFLGAGASSAQVSREVERLWERNRARIGTGDRNLVLAGTTLQFG